MLIIGAKGFAKELLETVCQIKREKHITFYDDISGDLPDLLFDEYTIIRNFNDAEKYLKSGDGKFALGIGNPIFRYKLAQKFKAIGGELVSVISPFAKIGQWENSIGAGSNILSNVVIESNNVIGAGNLIHVGALVSHDITTGKFCEISPMVNLLGEVSLGDFCSIGASAVILPKIKIGKNVIVGAGAVVTEDVPDNSMVVGVPAKIVKKLELLDF